MNESADCSGPEPPLIDLDELRRWILHEDEDLLAVNKPGWVVCHPSKRGPRSSLVGACRECTGLGTLRLISRLDRETSGIILLAKHKQAASLCQTAIQNRQAEKIYHAILEGELRGEALVNKPLSRDTRSLVYNKQAAGKKRGAQTAKTKFRPLVRGGGWTLAEVRPLTGRKHQIRAHARWLGHAVAGDKVYGPDETLFLEFIEKGFTERLRGALPMPRQALHAARLIFRAPGFGRAFRAPMPGDMREFCRKRLGMPESELERL